MSNRNSNSNNSVEIEDIIAQIKKDLISKEEAENQVYSAWPNLNWAGESLLDWVIQVSSERREMGYDDEIANGDFVAYFGIQVKWPEPIWAPLDEYERLIADPDIIVFYAKYYMKILFFFNTWMHHILESQCHQNLQLQIPF